MRSVKRSEPLASPEAIDAPRAGASQQAAPIAAIVEMGLIYGSWLHSDVPAGADQVSVQGILAITEPKITAWLINELDAWLAPAMRASCRWQKTVAVSTTTPVPTTWTS